MKLCRLHNSDEYDEYWYPVDFLWPFRNFKRIIKFKTVNTLDKVNHRYICKLIKRHKFSQHNDSEPISLLNDHICTRCGEKCSANLIMSEALFSVLNSEANVFAGMAKGIWSKPWKIDNKSVI